MTRKQTNYRQPDSGPLTWLRLHGCLLGFSTLALSLTATNIQKHTVFADTNSASSAAVTNKNGLATSTVDSSAVTSTVSSATSSATSSAEDNATSATDSAVSSATASVASSMTSSNADSTASSAASSSSSSAASPASSDTDVTDLTSTLGLSDTNVAVTLTDGVLTVTNGDQLTATQREAIVEYIESNTTITSVSGLPKEVRDNDNDGNYIPYTDNGEVTMPGGAATLFSENGYPIIDHLGQYTNTDGDLVRLNRIVSLSGGIIYASHYTSSEGLYTDSAVFSTNFAENVTYWINSISTVNTHSTDEIDWESSVQADGRPYYYLTTDEVFKALTTLTPDKFGKIWIHYALNGVETDAPVGISLANMSINIPVEVEFSSSSHKYESGTSASSYEQATVTVKDGSTEGNHTFDIDLTSNDYSITPTDSDAADTYKYTLSASSIQKVNAAITAYARDTTSGSFQDVVNVSTGQALINYSYQLSNSSATGTINITNTSPTISANNQSVKYGDPDSLLDIIGATATDIEDGNITSGLTITDVGGYSATVAGTYTVTLSVTDAAGATTTKTVTVTVQPNTMPTLTVTNKTTTFGNSTSLLSILGATATDTEDGDLTSGITITDDGGYNATVAGTYTVTLAVTDSGGATTTATATVTVQPDGIPTITATDKTTNFGTTTSLLELIGATASDAEDGNLTQQVTITNDGGYSATTPGTYTVTLAVTDSAGATSTTTVRVTVPAQPNQTPQLNVTNQTTTFGNPASLLTTLGATATDAEDGDLTNAITVTDDGGYNAQVAGTYTVTLSVTDSAGTTTTKSTNITVQPDTTASSVANSSAASVASSSATTKSDAPAAGLSTAPSQAEPAGSVAVQPAANAVGTTVIAVYTDNNVPDTIIRVSGPVGEPVMPSKTAILGAYFQDGFGIGSNDITPDTTFAAQPQQFTIRMRSARSQLELPPQRPHVFNLTVQRPVPIKKEATTTPITRHQPIIFDWQRNLLHMSPARGSDGEHSVVGRYLQSLSGRIFFGTHTQG